MIGRCALSAILWTGALTAASPSAATVEAFDRYVRQNEARIDSELKAGSPFLWIDAHAEPRLLAQLNRSETVLQEIRPADARIPGGQAHHWVALAFVAGADLQQALGVLTDYENYQTFHQPYIVSSKVLRREGGDATITLRLFRKKGLTAVIDTEHEVSYVQLDATRGYSRTYTTRVTEVDKDGRAADDRGFLWRHHSWWRFLERDGGVYIQYEALSLSRALPAGIGWLLGGFLTGAHKDFAFNMVNGTRQELLARRARGAWKR